MNAFVKVPIFVAILALTSSCKGTSTGLPMPSNVNRVEVYARDIGVLAPVRYSAEALVTHASHQAVLDPTSSDWENMVAVASSCNVDRKFPKESVDAYVVARFYAGGDLVRTLVASPFNFYLTPGSADVCSLNHDDRDFLLRVAGLQTY